MAVSKMPPPRGPKAPPPPAPALKIRAGMGDLDAPAVEVWTDEDYQRATGLFKLLPDGTPTPEIAPETLRDMYRGMLRMRLLDERMVHLQRQGRIGFYAEARGQEASVVA